jgi:hypothetical protein
MRQCECCGAWRPLRVVGSSRLRLRVCKVCRPRLVVVRWAGGWRDFVRRVRCRLC